MKMAKSYKLMMLLFALILSVILAFAVVNVPTITRADSTGVASKTCSIAVDDLGIETTYNENVNSVKVSFTTDSYNSFGYKTNIKVTDPENFEYSDEVEYEFTFIVNGTDAGNIKLNDKVLSTKFTVSEENILTLAFKVENNLIYASANGSDFTTITDDANLKVKKLDKVVAYTVIGADTASETATFAINYIDQKLSDNTHAYRKDYTVSTSSPLPRICLADSFFEIDDDGNVTCNVNYGYAYSLSSSNVDVCYIDVADEITFSNLSFVCDDENFLISKETTTTKTITFKKAKDFKVAINNASKVTIDEYTFTCGEYKGDTTAPTYTDKAELLKAYQEAVTRASYTYKNDEKKSITIGSDKYLELPSMRELVSDEFTSYDLMISNSKYVIHYMNSSTKSTNTSSFKIPVTKPGEYKFYIIFTDLAGNSMDESEIYDTENNLPVNEDLIFSFTLVDDNKVEVTAPQSQYNHYVGVRFIGSSFIYTDNATVEYKLEYHALNKPDSDFVDVTSDSDLSFEKSAFTPNAKGFYRVTCNVTSSTDSLDTATTSFIVNVGAEQSVVKPDTHWARNNVWSIVFLSIGTACLIAIIVLLCIKPKKKDDESDK